MSRATRSRSSSAAALAEPPQQVKAVEPGDREPCDDLAEDQIVDPSCAACPARTAGRGSARRPGSRTGPAACRTGPAMPDESAVRYADGRILPTSARRPRSRRPRGLPENSAAPDPKRRTIRSVASGSVAAATSAPRTPGEVDRSVLGLLPDDQHSRCLEHFRALAHELGGEFGRLSRNATRPSDEASELALKAVMMSAEVSDEHGDDGDLHDPDEERVHDEGAHVKEERGVRVRSRVENDRRDRRPHGTAALPSKRAADYQEGEVREERTAWRVSEEIEEREGREVEAMLGDAPAGAQSAPASRPVRVLAGCRRGTTRANRPATSGSVGRTG